MCPQLLCPGSVSSCGMVSGGRPVRSVKILICDVFFLHSDTAFRMELETGFECPSVESRFTGCIGIVCFFDSALQAYVRFLVVKEKSKV